MVGPSEGAYANLRRWKRNRETMSEPTVERFTVFGREGTNCIAVADGHWVRFSDYDTLTEERDRLERDRDFWKEQFQVETRYRIELADKGTLQALQDANERAEKAEASRDTLAAALTKERDRLKEELERQVGLLEMTSEGWAKQLADVLAERDKAREYGAEARILGTKAEDKRIHEQHRASVAEAERDRLALANAELLAGLTSVLQACDGGRMVARGAGGMTIDAQIRRSVINGVPAWPIEEARALLDKHKATSTEREGE